MAAVGNGAGVRVGRLKPLSRILAPIALALVMAGCGTGRDDAGSGRAPVRTRALTPAQRDSVALADEERAGAHRDSLLAVETRTVLADWEEAWTRVLPGFKLDSLRWQKRDTLAMSISPLASQALDSLTQRRWKLEFTADRWVAVDPDFGRVFAASGKLQGRAEPRVTLYDFRAHQIQVLDHGPEGRPFAVAGWLGERRLVVAGWRPWPGAVKTIRPAVWIYDLDSLHRTTGMGPPVSEPELQAHEAMLELLIRMRNAPARRR